MTLEELRKMRNCSVFLGERVPDEFEPVFDLAEAMLMLEEMAMTEGCDGFGICGQTFDDGSEIWQVRRTERPPGHMTRHFEGDADTAGKAIRAAHEEWKK